MERFSAEDKGVERQMNTGTKPSERPDKDGGNKGQEIFAPHDHGACVSQSFAVAEARCQDTRARLTDVRRKVLTLLLEEHRPLGAYAILERLRGSGHSAQPPVAYRALDFLIDKGLVHRIESLNAYVACTDPERCSDPTFLICQQCDRVAETGFQSVPSTAALAAQEIGFVIERELHEVRGTCPACTAPPASTSASLSQ